jgi:hypothetical protein
MNFKDYYKILELNSTASQEEIKKSYRRLALKYHPDKNFGDKSSEARFKEIQEAYEMLSDVSERSNYDLDYQKYNGKSNPKDNVRSEAKKETANDILHAYLMRFRSIREAVEKLDQDQQKVNQEALYKKLNDLLDKNCIEFFLSLGDVNVNTQIINDVFISCRPLAFPYVENLSIKLSKLAGTDNETILKIHAFIKQRKIKSYWDKYKAIVALFIFILFFAIKNFDFFGKSTSQQYENSSSTNSDSVPSSNYSRTTGVGDTNSSLFKNLRGSIKSSQELYKDWNVTHYSSGNSPGCYDYTPHYNKSLDNKLKVSVGSNTDVAIKVVNIKSRKCIRYVYIRSGETYEIKNIPEGKYYLKIAFGKDWMEKTIKGKCIGKFVSNAAFKKGDEILDFNLIYNGIKKEGEDAYKSYQVPSFSLKLDVITNNFLNQFSSTEISENEFQD